MRKIVWMLLILRQIAALETQIQIVRFVEDFFQVCMYCLILSFPFDLLCNHSLMNYITRKYSIYHNFKKKSKSNSISQQKNHFMVGYTFRI